MIIAIPITDGKLSMHFGHCDQFDLLDVDTEKKEILKKETLSAPPHEPGLLPKWLGERNVNLVIAGGMGSRAKELFNQTGIKTVVGAPSDTSEEIVLSYVKNTLELGGNLCDH